MTNYDKKDIDIDLDKFWRINREVYEKYFGKETYQRLLDEKRFEEMDKILEEGILFKE